MSDHEKEETPKLSPEIQAAVDKLKEVEDQTKDELKDPEKSKKELLPPCPRCGFDHESNKIIPTEEDKREFQRSVMGMRPFSKRFSLMNGELEILIVGLDGSVVDAMNNIIRGLQSDEGNILMEISLKLRMLLMCLEIKTSEKTISFDEIKANDLNPSEDGSGADTVIRLFKERFDLPEIIHKTLARVITEFQLLQGALEEGMMDENFYKGGGLA